ncbi:MAG: signal peptidase [Lachnospiraceae bacterium]|jgi:signal peptidase I|nr:signal peptidase [Lachnospiraceae bacterium]
MADRKMEFKEDVKEIENVEDSNKLEKIEEENNTELLTESYDAHEEKEDSVNYVKEIWGMVKYFTVVIVIVLLIHQFLGMQIEVSGSSMESTLQDADHLILEKVSYSFGVPERFDIIVFRPYEDDKDTYYIKRIIGLPGEKVQIKGSDIYINDVLLAENYGMEQMLDGGIANDAIILGDDEYFVLGDNRNHSKDSREIGPIKRAAITGRAWVRIWPMNHFDVLEHQ